MLARILIADDAPQVLSVVKWVLESHSLNWKVCAEAADGLRAVEKAVETKPELIILDLQMPVMDGLSASTKIAQLLPEVPILLFTLHKSADLDLQAKRAGVREVVSKYDAAALVKAVERLLEENQASTAPICNQAPS